MKPIPVWNVWLFDRRIAYIGGFYEKGRAIADDERFVYLINGELVNIVDDYVKELCRHSTRVLNEVGEFNIDDLVTLFKGSEVTKTKIQSLWDSAFEKAEKHRHEIFTPSLQA